MPQMQFDWTGLIKLLAYNLYSEKRVFLRELIQNAHDAIVRRANTESDTSGRIDVTTDRSKGLLIVADNGIGMNEQDLREYLSTIGLGATRQQQGIPGLIGHFGIGFLSAFIVADRVTVDTKKLGTDAGWRWTNTGSREYSIEPYNVSRVGTTVTVHVREGERGLLDEGEVRETIKRYSDLLLVPIFINNARTPANAMKMPWEKENISSPGSDIECRLYISEAMGDEALETIPFQVSGASGLLYITKNRVVGVDQPRAVRLFVRRMLVTANLPDILPAWATFVNGIINSDCLLPTAARDNVMRDDSFFILQEALGKLIVNHLQQIKDKKPTRFTEIQRYHYIGIRAACAHYTEFFDKFIDLVEWHTNPLPGDHLENHTESVLRTLPEIVEVTRRQQQNAVRHVIRCFGSGNTANLFFQMGYAANVLIVDASGFSESGLIKHYVEHRLKHETCHIVWVDVEDDPVLFRSLSPGESPDVEALALTMGKLRIPSFRKPREGSSEEQASISSAAVAAKRFEPASIPALVRPGKKSEEVERAQYVIDDPDSPETYKALARAVIEAAGSQVHVTINANNSLIQRVAKEKLEPGEKEQLLLGIYNSAFLSSDMMSNYNASILHRNLVHFMEAGILARQEKDELILKNKALMDQVASITEAEPRKDVNGSIRTVFVMIPFSPNYNNLIAALRILIEDTWGCQLFLSSDRKYEDRILDSVKVHINQADLFIAELTESNPNVMFELGAVFASRRARPIVSLFKAVGDGGQPRKLPADWGGMIYVDYSKHAEEGESVLATFLDGELKKDEKVAKLLVDTGTRFVSPRRIREALRHIITITDRECRDLSRAYPTAKSWEGIEIIAVERILDKERREAAQLIVKRVRDSLQ